jgi:signal transduction histidine kinase
LFLDAGGRPCTVDPALPMPIRGLRASSYLTGKVTYDNDFVNSQWVDLMPRGHVVLNNVMFAPLIIDRKTVGIIGLANKSIPFTERDAQMATAFGEIASIALINSQTLERLSENEKLLKTHSENLEQMVEEKTRQLRDSERLATIGATAGMVGHDIRNPLQAIISDLYLAKEELVFCPDSENKTAIKESLSEIEKNADYINKIVADLQDFARPLNPSIQKMDLQSVCSDILSKANIPKNIKLSCTISENASELVADENWVKRILFNLVNNAVQAMPTGGDLTILGIREGSDLIISVQDTGLGIPEDVKSKLFIPLFTTKSKGQGFGLAVIKRLTEALNGKVTFNSIMGKGTKFNIILPAPSGELTKTASETKG